MVGYHAREIMVNILTGDRLNVEGQTWGYIWRLIEHDEILRFY